MKERLISLTKHFYRFGIISGLRIYFQNSILKKGYSTISLKSFPFKILLRRSTSDIQTFNQIFLFLEYRYNIRIIPNFIVDCGANIGLSTLYFKNIYPNAFISAIEPEDSNFQLLKKNTQKYSSIDCIKAGIWNKNAILKIVDENNFGNWGFLCKEVGTESEDTIKAISIKDIMLKYNKTEIDLLKIDIEGAELELFSSGYEDWLPKTKVIIIELHDWFRKGCSNSFFSALIKYNFSVFSNGENIICIRN